MIVSTNDPARPVIDAGLSLLDRQIVDKDGLMAGKVDDLEVALSNDGTAPPVVSAILAGPGALAGQLGGRVGRWIASVRRRRDGSHKGGPARVSFSMVKQISEHVELRVSRTELEVNRGEAWVRNVIISKVPGAYHEAE
jgi:hypothetical protein